MPKTKAKTKKIRAASSAAACPKHAGAATQNERGCTAAGCTFNGNPPPPDPLAGR
jgi:hypothetical protein